MIGCKPMPKNMCECLEEAFVLSKAKEKNKSESFQKNIDKEIKTLARHCHRLLWRGATCPQEDLMVIIKKQNPASFWDAGEGITMVMQRPYIWPAKSKLEEIKRLQNYLKRFDGDSTQTLFPRMFNDSTEVH
jgi:hypothetical protein